MNVEVAVAGSGVCVLASGGHAAFVRWACRRSGTRDAAGPVVGPSVCVPRTLGRSGENYLLGSGRVCAVVQASGGGGGEVSRGQGRKPRGERGGVGVYLGGTRSHAGPAAQAVRASGGGVTFGVIGCIYSSDAAEGPPSSHETRSPDRNPATRYSAVPCADPGTVRHASRRASGSHSIAAASRVVIEAPVRSARRTHRPGAVGVVRARACRGARAAGRPRRRSARARTRAKKGHGRKPLAQGPAAPTHRARRTRARKNLSGVRRGQEAHRRRDKRTGRVRAGVLVHPRTRAAQVCVPVLPGARRGRGQTRQANREGVAGAGPRRARRHEQVLRPPAAVPARVHAGAPRRRAFPKDPVRLGHDGGGQSTTARRADEVRSPRIESHPHRRHAGAGAGRGR